MKAKTDDSCFEVSLHGSSTQHQNLRVGLVIEQPCNLQLFDHWPVLANCVTASTMMARLAASRFLFVRVEALQFAGGVADFGHGQDESHERPFAVGLHGNGRHRSRYRSCG